MPMFWEKSYTKLTPLTRCRFEKIQHWTNDFFALRCFFPHHHHQHLRIRSSFNSPWVSLTHSQLTKIHQNCWTHDFFRPLFVGTGPAASVTPVQCGRHVLRKGSKFRTPAWSQGWRGLSSTRKGQGLFHPRQTPFIFGHLKGGYNSHLQRLWSQLPISKAVYREL